MNELIKAKIDAITVPSPQKVLFDNAGETTAICGHHKHSGTVASRTAEPGTEAYARHPRDIRAKAST